MTHEIDRGGAGQAERNCDVIYYQVVRDSQLPSGCTLKHDPLSPPCATEEAVRGFFNQLIESYPDAYMMEGRHFLCPDSPSDMRFRERLLSELATEADVPAMLEVG